MFIGICFIMYPFVGNYFFENKQLKDIEEYEQDINDSSEEEIEQIKTNYINHSGIIGYIEIPKIDLKLAIYPDTREKYLLNGAGIFNESLPIDKVSPYHLVLVGHTRN